MELRTTEAHEDCVKYMLSVLDSFNSPIVKFNRRFEDALKRIYNCACVLPPPSARADYWITTYGRRRDILETIRSASREFEWCLSMVEQLFQQGLRGAEIQSALVEQLKASADDSSAAQLSLQTHLLRELAIAQREWGEDLFIDPGTERSYGENDYTQGRWRLVLRTGPIEFTEDSVHVDLGTFYIIIDLGLACHGDDSAEALFVSADTPNHAVDTEGVYHPHIEGGVLCLGDAYKGIAGGIKHLCLSDVLRLAERFLHTYNPAGPYVPIQRWYGEDIIHCTICGDEVIGDEREKMVELLQQGFAHRGCADYDEQRDAWVDPQAYKTCPCCLKVVYGPAEMIVLNGQECACADCAQDILEESQAARRGEFICPYCRSHHSAEDVEEKRVIIGFRDYGCTNCCQVQEGQLVILPTGEAVQQRPDQDEPRNRTRQPIRPTPRVRRTVPCECGARVEESSLRSCPYTGCSVCDVCDPDRMGFGHEFYAHQAYMDAELLALFNTHLDDFTKDFLELQSIFDLPIERAREVFLRVARAILTLGSSKPPIAAQALIQEKADWWNTHMRDLGDGSLVTIREGDFHDRRIVEEWQTRAEAGEEWSREKLRVHGYPNPGWAEETGESQDAHEYEDEDEYEDEYEDGY